MSGYENEFGSEAPPPAILSDELPLEFCTDVFQRSMTIEELDNNNYVVLVDSLDNSLDALKKYPEWKQMGPVREVFAMRTAVVHKLTAPKTNPLIIFLHEDLLLH